MLNRKRPAPVYDRDGITLYNADCLDILPTLGQVDHVITAPPYAPRAMKNARSAKNISVRRDGVYYEFGYGALMPETRRAVAPLLNPMRWLLVWCDIESASAWRQDLECAGRRYIRTGVWVRENGAPQFSGDRPAQGVEACVIAHGASKLAWNGGGLPATWIGPIVNSQSRPEHSSPKPLWLMRQLIEQFTDPGDTILDPFCGSGTTLVAARDLGRKAIGIELSAEYAATAVSILEHGVKGAALVKRGQEPLFIHE